MIPRPTADQAVLIGWALFTLSELLAVSRLRDNSIIQVSLRCLSLLFPYQPTRNEESRRMRRQPRDAQGRCTRRRSS